LQNVFVSESEGREMDLICEERLSDSPFVERVWYSQGERAGPFIAMADTESALVVTKYRDQTIIILRGPSSKATPAFCPADAEFFGIQFKPGAFLHNLPARMVANRQDLDLPEATRTSFWLNGSAWQYPNYENADTFVNRLVHEGVLVYDRIVGAILKKQAVDLSLRTVQRRFSQATGLTQNSFYQINRARYATGLVKQGLSIVDTVYEAGYFDQPHLTRSLKHFIGLTPAQLFDQSRTERLSFLYKKNPSWSDYNTNVLRTADIYSRSASGTL
jgi:AraC-like DNA-binding protein